MRISIVGFKGGVGKTTTAVHLAAYFQLKGPTLLIDGDPNRSATEWASKGKLPFTVEDERRAARSGSARSFEHVVIDTEARPSGAELRDLASDCDLLVIPTTPDLLALKALQLTLRELEEIGTDHYRILLAIVPPRPSRDGEEARALLTSSRLPVFKSEIPRLVAFQKAALAGVPVYAAPDPRAATGWQGYEKAGKEITR
jgi:chromosome partitioning protein